MKTTDDRGKRLLTRKEIEDIYGIPVRTLEHHSSQGTGPTEIRGIRRDVLYAEPDVVQWLVDHGYPAEVAAVDQVGRDVLRALQDEVSGLREQVAELTALVRERVA